MLIGTSSCLSLSRRVYRRLVLLKAAGSYKGAYWAAEVRIPSIQMIKLVDYGEMSKATKKKYVKREIVESDYIPQNGQFIAKVLASRGNNLHEVEPEWSSTDEQTAVAAVIVSMPVKFRKTIWIKRDNYVICNPIDEGTKVKGEIIACLLPDHIRHLRNISKWPKKFDESGFSNGDSGSLKQKGVDSYLNSDIPLPPSSDEEDEQLSGNDDVCNLNRITSYNHEEEDEDDVDSDENS